MKYHVIRLAVVFGVLTLWEFLAGGFTSKVQVLDPFFFSRPSLVWLEFQALFQDGFVIGHIVTTIQETLIGLLLAVVTGTSTALLLGYCQSIGRIFLPFMNTLNSIPILGLAPMIIMWIGLGIASKIVISAILSYFPIFFSVYQGLKHVDDDLLNALQIMGAERWHRFRFVVLPTLLSWLLAGFRPASGLALVGAVIGEFLGATSGLGYLLIAAQNVLNTHRGIAILVLLAIMGMALDWGSRELEVRLLRWRS